MHVVIGSWLTWCNRFCEAGTAEYLISGTVTASSYTGCHIDDGQTYAHLSLVL